MQPMVVYNTLRKPITWILSDGVQDGTWHNNAAENAEGFSLTPDFKRKHVDAPLRGAVAARLVDTN